MKHQELPNYNHANIFTLNLLWATYVTRTTTFAWAQACKIVTLKKCAFCFSTCKPPKLKFFFKNGISMNETLQSVKLNMQFIFMTTNFISKMQNMAPLLVKNQDDKRTFTLKCFKGLVYSLHFCFQDYHNLYIYTNFEPLTKLMTRDITM